jgi:hypothetical protein
VPGPAASFYQTARRCKARRSEVVSLLVLALFLSCGGPSSAAGPSNAVVQTVLRLDALPRPAAAHLTIQRRDLPLSPAEEQNGISRAVLVTWTGLTRTDGAAHDASGELLCLKVPQGWLAGVGGAMGDTHHLSGETFLVSDDGALVGDGDFSGTYAADDAWQAGGDRLSCTLTLTRQPSGVHTGSYACTSVRPNGTKRSSGEITDFVRLPARTAALHDLRITGAPDIPGSVADGLLVARDASGRMVRRGVTSDANGDPVIRWDLGGPSDELTFHRAASAAAHPTHQ